MSTTSPSKYAANQFIRVTVGSYPLMSETLAASKSSAWNGGNIERKRNEERSFFVGSPALEGVLVWAKDALKGWTTYEESLA
jgi:hypothetical protein